MGAELGPGWVLIMDNAPSHKAREALEWCEATLHEPGRDQFNCPDWQHTHRDTPNDAHAPNPTLFTTPRRHRPPDDSPYMNLLVTWERDHTGDVYSSLPYLAQGGGGAGLGCCAFLAAPGRLLRD